MIANDVLDGLQKSISWQARSRVEGSPVAVGRKALGLNDHVLTLWGILLIPWLVNCVLSGSPNY